MTLPLPPAAVPLDAGVTTPNAPQRRDTSDVDLADDDDDDDDDDDCRKGVRQEEELDDSDFRVLLAGVTA